MKLWPFKRVLKKLTLNLMKSNATDAWQKHGPIYSKIYGRQHNY